jgi:hypothetical protein
LKKKNIFSILCVLGGCLILLPTVSFSQFTEYSNEFLNIGAGARGMAMGNAQVASVDDVTAGYWNPAGLIHVKDAAQVALMHSEYFAGIGKYDFGAVALPLANNKRAIGFTLLRFAVDDIPNTLFLVAPDGSINYNNVQSFSSADYAFLFSFAQKVKTKETKEVSFGFNAKVIRRVVGTFANAWGFGIDAAFQYRGDHLRIGFVAKDLTSTFNAWTFSFSDAEKQQLLLADNNVPVKSTELTAPSTIVGLGYRFFNIKSAVNLMAEIGANITYDGKRNTAYSTNQVSVDPHFGLEFSLKNLFFVRAGITNIQQVLADNDSLNQQKTWIYQPSIGAGFKLGPFVIDYAYTNLANQTNPLYTNVFALKLNLEGNGGRSKASPQSIPQLQPIPTMQNTKPLMYNQNTQ